MPINSVFAIGVSGVSAFATGLEAISNNIANSQTTGYKRVRTDFSDLVTQNAPDLNEAVGTGVTGTGVAASHHQLVSEQGTITRTNNNTDLAIAGEGFFVVSRTPDANPASSPFLYTRSGSFRADNDGNLVNESGFYLKGIASDGISAPQITGGLNGLETVNIDRLPPTLQNNTTLGSLVGIDFDNGGNLLGKFSSGESRILFSIPLALFTNSEGLEQADDTTFLETPDAGTFNLFSSGQSGAGSLENAALELSTTDIGQEFSTLIATQRAYATNTRVISVADELWRTITDIAR